MTPCAADAKLHGTVASPDSSSTEANQAILAQRLRAEAEKAAKRADAIKQQVRLAKTILKRTRQLAKASKKAAKQARKKAKAAEAALHIRIRKSPASRVTASGSKGSVKRSKSKAEGKSPTAQAPTAQAPKPKAGKHSTRRIAAAASPRQPAGTAAEAARSVIERLEGAPQSRSALREDVDQEPGK
jgi:hypothetical protein